MRRGVVLLPPPPGDRSERLADEVLTSDDPARTFRDGGEPGVVGASPAMSSSSMVPPRHGRPSPEDLARPAPRLGDVGVGVGPEKWQLRLPSFFPFLNLCLWDSGQANRPPPTAELYFKVTHFNFVVFFYLCLEM